MKPTTMALAELANSDAEPFGSTRPNGCCNSSNEAYSVPIHVGCVAVARLEAATDVLSADGRDKRWYYAQASNGLRTDDDLAFGIALQSSHFCSTLATSDSAAVESV